MVLTRRRPWTPWTLRGKTESRGQGRTRVEVSTMGSISIIHRTHFPS